MKINYNKLIRIVFYSYFFIVIFNLLSSLLFSYFKEEGKENFLKIPVFQQAWNMFSPPPKSSTKIFYRVFQYKNAHKDSTEWFDIMGALYHKKHTSWLVGSISSDLSYLLYNSMQDIEINAANCYASDSLTASLEKYCDNRLFFGDSLIIQYIKKFHLKEDKKYRKADSLKLEYQLIEDHFPPYQKRQLDYNNLKNHTFDVMNRPLIKIVP